jgi:hypothetical protein
VADFAHSTNGAGVPTTRYEIRDSAGQIVAVHARQDRADGKRLWWEQPDGSRGLGGRKVVELPLYGVEALAAAPADKPVIVTEGEKARDALASCGFLAVATVTGASTIPNDAALRWLLGRPTVLWADADAPGRSHMDKLAAALTRLGHQNVRRGAWADAGDGDDAHDFFARGGTAGDCQVLIDTAVLVTCSAHVNGHPAANGSSSPDDAARRETTGRPEIDTGNLGLDAMAAAAWSAIEAANEPARLYRYGTALAWLVADAAGKPQIEMLDQDHVRHHLAEVAAFIRWTPGARGRGPECKPAFPPVALAADMLAVHAHANLPRLHRLVRVPVFTADGRLLTDPGYDRASGLYFAPPSGLSIPAVPERPTAGEIAEARTWLLEELLGDFPFVSDADRTHAVAMLVTPILRELVVGDVPLFVVSKPTPRTGAGLLTRVVSIIADGAPAAPKTISRNEEEMRKRLTSFLLASPGLVLLDNLHGRLDSAALAAILTCGGTWDDRLLGRTQTVSVPVRATFVLTGNNPALSNEIAGRAVLIRLDPKVEDPSTRTGFRHPRLDAWAVEHRGRVLWSALTLGQAWIAAGRPHAATAFGGFEAWAGVLSGVAEVAGLPDFLGNRRVLFEEADEENAQIRGFLADWWDKHGDSRVSVKTLLEIAKEHELPIDAKSDLGMLTRLGRIVRSLRERRFVLSDAAVVVRQAGIVKGTPLWQLKQVGRGDLGDPGDPSSVNAYARARAHARAEREPAETGSPTSPPSPPDNSAVIAAAAEWIE